MVDNSVSEKSFEFAVRVVNLYKYLIKEHKEFVMARQILRCGTSIGANIAEAQKGQSKADFTAKMQIALKEACDKFIPRGEPEVVNFAPLKFRRLKKYSKKGKIIESII